jgi:threonine dehydrogenase-like Zn-dependent dehydrogenase
LPVWLGRDWFTYPRSVGEPGHEGWGIVDEAGDGVSAIAAGTRVAFLSSHAFAEYDIAPASEVVPLPPSLEGRPFPGEALACAFNVVHRARIAPGDTVAVVGVGFLGAVVTRLAADLGARILAVSRRAFALDVARSQGASAVVRATSTEETVDEVLRLTAGVGCQCAIEAAGTQAMLDIASAVVGVRGRLVIAGYHQDGPRMVDMQSWNWRGLDVVNAHERDPQQYVEGMRRAIAAVEAGWNPDPLYTHTLPLSQLGRALDLLADRPAGFLKSLVYV